MSLPRIAAAVLALCLTSPAPGGTPAPKVAPPVADEQNPPIDGALALLGGLGMVIVVALRRPPRR